MELNNLYDILKFLEKRPEMYLGNRNLSSLYNFIIGYEQCCFIHKIPKEQIFPPFYYFHEWTRTKYNFEGSANGWKSMILEKNDHDEEKSFEEFFDSFYEFIQLYPIKAHMAKISDKNLTFHRSSECEIKTIVDFETYEKEPLYQHVDEVFIIEISQDFGFANFLKYKGEPIGYEWKKIFPDLKSAKESFTSLFGSGLDWKEINDNVQKITLDIIKNKC